MPLDIYSLDSCCFKALKHNQAVCPVCGTRLFGGQQIDEPKPEPKKEEVLAKRVMDKRIAKIIRKIKMNGK